MANCCASIAPGWARRRGRVACRAVQWETHRGDNPLTDVKPLIAVSLGVASATWSADKLQLGDLRPWADGSLPAATCGPGRTPEWAAHLRAGAPNPTSWSVSDDGRWVRHTSPNGDRLFMVGADGRLLDPTPPPQPPPSRPAATQWHDACVVSSPASKGIPLEAAMPLPPLRPPVSSNPGEFDSVWIQWSFFCK
jgi:hypothetical protein